MPIDMPLEELKKYTGRNPRPADFDTFWDESLKELDQTDPSPVFTRVDFPAAQVECYDLYFKGTQGASIHAKFMRPKSIVGKAPAILKFHGLGGGGAAWQWPELLVYASQGFCVAGLDCRGQSGSSQDVGAVSGTTFSSPFLRGINDAPEKLLYRNIFLDTAQLARIVMALDYVDENRVGVIGCSQGGALALACAALVPEIKRCVAGCPYLCDYQRVSEMGLGQGPYEGLTFYFRAFDPQHQREKEFFEKLGYIDVQNLAPRIRAEVLMYTGLIDTTCPPSTQFAAFNKITSQKTVRIFPEFGHETYCGFEDETFSFLMKL